MGLLTSLVMVDHTAIPRRLISGRRRCRNENKGVLAVESEQIRSWLELMRLPYNYDPDGNRYSIIYDVEGHRLPVIIEPTKPEWIKIRVRLGEINKIPEANKLGFLREMLYGNFVLDDVTFSMDKDGVMYSENDIPRSSNLENFHSELTAVVLGALTFVREIAPKFDMSPENLIGEL